MRSINSRLFASSHAHALLLCVLAIGVSCFLFSPLSASAATINAASCSQTDVQAALNAATAGATVNIPAGTCTWTTPVSIYPAIAPNVSVIGQTTCTGAGQTLSCTDKTIIIDSINRSSGDPAGLNITLPTTGTFRLSGITWRSGGSNSYSDNGILRLGPDGNYSPVARLDHMHFDNVRYVGWATSNVSGVADHIRYDMVSGTADNSTRPMGIDQDNTRWNQATNFGTQSSWFYVEDSYFSNGIANDCFSSGKQVYRYNYMTNSGLQQHGTGHAGSNRGCRAMEVYGNNINGGATSHTTAFGYYSGPMVMFGNSVGSGTFNSAYQLTSTRSSNYTYSQGPTPGDHGYCGSAFNGTASQWDGNNPVSTGYPCLDQVGRGIGDLLSSDFPTLTNSTLGCIVNDAYPGHCSAWPRQALEPAYEWSDTGSTITGAWDSVYNGPITKNVDYYTDHSNTNCSPGAASCTAGIGVGTLAQRPANCTTGAESGGGVGWWATDQGGNWNTANGTANDGALYKCTATNTWTLYYTPYTYPNPLQGGGGGGDTTPPSTPTNLAASAISSSQINLTWTASTDNVGVTGYKIFRGGTQVGTSATNSYSDTGLSASTAYSYTVSAYDAAGNNSAQSSSASATTQSGGNGINGSYSTNFTGTENPINE